MDLRFWNGLRERRLVPQRGIIGNVLPRLSLSELDLGKEWILVIYTDGINGRFALDDSLSDHSGGPPTLARALLERWARPVDDATVVVACRAERPHEAKARPGILEDSLPSR